MNASTRTASLALETAAVPTAKSSLPRAGALVAVGSLLLAAAAPAVSPADAATPAATTLSSYNGSAYGTYVKIGTEVRSGPSAPITYACNTSGQIRLANTTTGLKLAPVITTGVTSTTGDSYASPVRSRTSAATADVNLLGGLVRATAVKAVSSTTRSGSGFSLSSTGTTLTGLKVAGIPVRADAAPNTRISLAGFGHVVVNEQTRQANGLRVSGVHVYVTQVNALKVAIGSHLVVSDAVTSLSGPVVGVLGGHAYGSYARLNATAVSGPSFTRYMPCLGTDGVRRVNTGAALNIGTAVKTGTITNTALGTVTATTAKGELTSTVQSANLINGLVKASVIKASAKATRTSKAPLLSDAGSSFGSLSVAKNAKINANVAPNTKVSLPGVGTLYLHQVIRNSNTVTVIMIHLVLTNPVGGLAAGTDIRVATASATVR